ncbi:hypothetical protein CA13_40760 [Planctomycetes bacterium CA13]|uniref:Uncharacterized protein n=1 Tax=Novipirellula herctigrandis TaxID=2527986 RepID=A0A5C5Z7X9_9BACT|nr:hypothetical protein CA13_40760 [Planctomycetes bacterium CA13]
MTAFATETRLVLDQMLVDDKSNEIPAVPELLKWMNLSGVVVTPMRCTVKRQLSRASLQQTPILF